MDYIVSGYYTPDYAGWYLKLAESLDRYQQPRDFVAVSKLGLGWEAETLRKAGLLCAAIDRHPGKAIIWLDVDCTVHGDLAPLAALDCDVGLVHYVKRKGRAAMLRLAAGTMLFQPTDAAYDLADTWWQLSRSATLGEDDEATLAEAIVRTHGVRLQQLAPEWHSPAHNPYPEARIIHDYASRHADKVHNLMRFLHRRLGTPAFTSQP